MSFAVGVFEACIAFESLIHSTTWCVALRLTSACGWRGNATSCDCRESASHPLLLHNADNFHSWLTPTPYYILRTPHFNSSMTQGNQQALSTTRHVLDVLSRLEPD